MRSSIARRLASDITSTKKPSLRLDGVFIPLTTPFDFNEDINYDKLTENLAFYNTTTCAGYVVAGSNGEVASVSPDERVNLVKMVREKAVGDKFVIGGAYCESTRATCELSQRMGDAGADAVMVMCPHYFKKRMTETAILDHYLTVADQSPVPVIIYNNTNVTGIDIGIPTLTKLAGHPNIRGVKDTNINKMSGIILETKKKGLHFDVLASSAGYLLAALQIGIIGLSGALCKEVCALYTLYTENKLQEAMDMHMRLVKVDILLSLAEFGVPGLKTAMDFTGLFGGPCRKPLQPSTPEDMEQIKKVLLEDGFLKDKF